MELDLLLLQNESKILEFKRDLSSIEPILKTIVAFANTAGGILIIGRSAEGELIGVKDVLKAEEMLANSIADRIRPTLLPEIEIATVRGKDLLILKVPHWRAPFYLKNEGIPRGVYIRLGSTSQPAGPELLAELQRSYTALSYDQQPLPELSMEALDLDDLAAVFKSEISKEKCQSLGILASVANRLVPTIGGLILFGKKEVREKWVPDARVSCARFQGTTKAQFIDRYDIAGTILSAVNEVPKFIARNTRLSAMIQDFQRKDVSEYSQEALREVVVNALVHADYSIPGSSIQIAVFSDRLEIQNPGMLPFGFTLEDLKAGVSRVRNRVLARVFHELHFMEAWGSGYRRVIQACEKNGYVYPNWEELGTFVRVTFSPHAQTVLREEIIEDREEEILRLFGPNEKLPFRKIFARLPSSLSERMLRYYLARLKAKRLLISKGKGPATYWQKL